MKEIKILNKILEDCSSKKQLKSEGLFDINEYST